MNTLLLIGIGPGDPLQITLQAIEALNRADVFFVLDKGQATHALVDARKEMVERHRPSGGYRWVQVADPQRASDAPDYVAAVQEWHGQRAALYARLLRESLGPGEVGAFLLWGEPGLYDSTLRILDGVRDQGVPFAVEVIPGISSVQALVARHCISLNRIGETLTILPGRQLSAATTLDNVVVMLDGRGAFAGLADDPQVWIYWGAYVGTPHELLVAGPLMAVKSEILRLRTEGKARHGWIMDTYLLRRQ